MNVATHIMALFAVLTQADLDALPPAVRERFAHLCRYWADKADPPKGVLRDLKGGRSDN